MKKMTLGELDNHFTHCAKIEALNEEMKNQKIKIQPNHWIDDILRKGDGNKTWKVKYAPDATSKCSPSTPTTAAPSVDNVTHVASKGPYWCMEEELFRRLRVHDVVVYDMGEDMKMAWCRSKGYRWFSDDMPRTADEAMALEQEILECLGLGGE